jgi:hypothetical protein
MSTNNKTITIQAALSLALTQMGLSDLASHVEFERSTDRLKAYVEVIVRNSKPEARATISKLLNSKLA